MLMTRTLLSMTFIGIILFSTSACADYLGMCPFQPMLNVGDWCCAQNSPEVTVNCDYNRGVKNLSPRCEGNPDWTKVSCNRGTESTTEVHPEFPSLACQEMIHTQ